MSPPGGLRAKWNEFSRVIKRRAATYRTRVDTETGNILCIRWQNMCDYGKFGEFLFIAFPSVKSGQWHKGVDTVTTFDDVAAGTGDEIVTAFFEKDILPSLPGAGGSSMPKVA